MRMASPNDSKQSFTANLAEQSGQEFSQQFVFNEGHSYPPIKIDDEPSPIRLNQGEQQDYL